MCLALAAGVSAADDPGGSYDSRLERAVEFYSGAQYSEAAAYLELLTRSAPDRKEAYLWLGKSKEKLKDWSAAREAFKRYAELSPRDSEGPRDVARTYEAEGKLDAALLWYRKALDIEPSNQDIRAAVTRLGNDVPAAPPPTAEAAQPSGTTDAARVDFWHQGLFGIVGARTVWWGRVLALIFYIGGLVNGAVMTPRLSRTYMPNIPSGVLGFQSLLGTAFSYVIFWGIPVDNVGWALFGSASVACGIAAANIDTN